MTSHPDRASQLRRILQLDPDRDAWAIYRLVAMVAFPEDVRLGLNLAFYRTFAAPRVAALLVRSGELRRRPAKRVADTGLLVYELVEHGFDHPRGQHVVAALNRMHRRWDIRQDDYRYVLATFVVIPSRWIDAHGWRPLTAHERQATAAFYRELGLRMGLTDLPATYDDAARLLDDYERRELRDTDAGRALLAATQSVLRRRAPQPFRFLSGPALRALLGERQCRLLGIPPAGPVTRALLAAGLRARARVIRARPPRKDSWFTPGQHASSVYPGGYELEQLGDGGTSVQERPS